VLVILVEGMGTNKTFSLMYENEVFVQPMGGVLMVKRKFPQLGPVKYWVDGYEK
jgi:hypothetical protein